MSACGTCAAYAAGCHCAACRKAIRAYQLERGAKRRADGLAVHGTRVAYLGGCRCPLCTAANADYMRRYRGSRQPQRQVRPTLSKPATTRGTPDSPQHSYAKGSTLEELLAAW
jgi:hypothetical protein